MDEVSDLASTRSQCSFLPWLLIAAAPVIFAVVSWDAEGIQDAPRGWLRLMGAPIVGVELFVIAYALHRGLRPIQTLIHAPSWVNAALAGLAAVAFWTTVLVAIEPLWSLIRTGLWVVHLFFGVSVWHLARYSPPSVRRSIWPAVVIGLCAYAAILALFVAVSHPPQFNWMYFGLAVTNIRQVGVFSVVGAAAALALSAYAADRRTSLIAATAAAVLLALSFWSGTRGSLVALWASFAVGGHFFRKLRTISAWVTVIGGSLAGAAVSLLGSTPSPSFGVARLAASGTTDIEAFGSGRLALWRGAWDAIVERPFFGYGEGQFRWTVPEALGAYNHPHNILLQLAFQWGFIGTFLFLGLAAFVGWRCLDRLRGGRNTDAAASLVLCSLVIMSMYDGTLFYSYPLMMVAMSLALILAGEDSNGRRISR